MYIHVFSCQMLSVSRSDHKEDDDNDYGEDGNNAAGAAVGGGRDF